MVYVRMPARPTMVVRLPTGGYTFPSNPMFDVMSPRRRRRPRRLNLRAAQVPILRQPPSRHALLANHPWQPSAQGLIDLATDPFPSPPAPPSPSVIEPSRMLFRLFSPRTADIPKVTLTEEMGIPGGKCAICLETYKPGDGVAWIPCQTGNHAQDHLFHHACIAQWAETCAPGPRTCPECRGEW